MDETQVVFSMMKDQEWGNERHMQALESSIIQQIERREQSKSDQHLFKLDEAMLQKQNEIFKSLLEIENRLTQVIKFSVQSLTE